MKLLRITIFILFFIIYSLGLILIFKNIIADGNNYPFNSRTQIMILNSIALLGISLAIINRLIILKRPLTNTKSKKLTLSVYLTFIVSGFIFLLTDSSLANLIIALGSMMIQISSAFIIFSKKNWI